MSDMNLFERIKSRTGGMLHPKVYRKIHDTAATAEADIVEIGTYRGAATIAMALGAPEHVRIKTVDPWDSQYMLDRFGSTAGAREAVTAVFREFGVEKKIEIYNKRSDEAIKDMNIGSEIGMLMLDADGAIDRDLALFYDYLPDGAPIVIDDYSPDWVRIVLFSGGKGRVDQKCRLAAMLVDRFEAEKILERDEVLNQTWFGRKPAGARPFDQVDLRKIITLYRQLTFGNGEIERQSYLNLKRRIQDKYPGLFQILYRLKKGR